MIEKLKEKLQTLGGKINENKKNNKIDKTIDNLKNKYGFSSIKRASELNKKTN